MSTKEIINFSMKETIINHEEHVRNVIFKEVILPPEERIEVIERSPLPSHIFSAIEHQNEKIINLTTESFKSIHEQLERIGNLIVKIDEKVNVPHNPVEISIKGNFGDKMTNYSSVGQIDNELHNLKLKLEESQRNLDDRKNPKEKLVKSVPEDEDFIVKFAQEKRSIMDTIEEQEIIKITYFEAFPKDYHYKVFEIILQEIGKFSFTDKAARLINEKDLQLSEDLKNQEIEKLKKELIFQEFKKNCFNAWKFKNLFLALEGLNLVEKKDVDDMKLLLERLRIEGSAFVKRGEDIEFVDELWEPLFEKLLKILKVLLFLTVGQKKIDLTKEKIKTIENELKHHNGNLSEAKGKIEMLEELKRKLGGQNTTYTVKREEVNEKIDIVPQDTVEERENKQLVKEIRNLRNSITNNFSTFVSHIPERLLNPRNITFTTTVTTTTVIK